MKRLLAQIFIAWLLTVPLMAPGVAGDCTPHYIKSWFLNSNEYLYVSEADYNNKNAYECQDNYCGNDDVVLVEGAHYLDGERVDSLKGYRCQLGTDDMWVVTFPPACSNPDTDCNVPYESTDGWRTDDICIISKSKKTGLEFKTAAHKYSDLCICTSDQLRHAYEQACLKVKQPEFDRAKKLCQDSGGKWTCDKFAINDDNASCSLKVIYSSDICEKGISSSACECPDGKDLDVIYQAGHRLGFICKTPSHNPGDACDANDLPQYATAGKWIASGRGGGPTCAATACRNGTYLVVNKSGASQGWCTAPIKCENGTMRIIDNIKTDRTCVDDAGAKVADAPADDADEQAAPAADDKKTEPVPVAPAVDTRNECERGLAGYIVFEGVCITTAEKQRIESERNAAEKRKKIESDISEIAGQLRQMNDAFGRSHWKNADGNFNTARLASDSIAGVVLGTAGGLVTGKVIKKNQIKKGFENIKCVIGGQTVADYADEFQVGRM